MKSKILLFVLASLISLTGVLAHTAEDEYAHHSGMFGGMMGGMYGLGMGIYGWLFGILILAVLVLLIAWLVKQIQKK